MRRDGVLVRIALVHATAVLALAVVCAARGWPVRGLFIGGGLAGFSFVSFWAIARAILVPGTTVLAAALNVTKVLLYLALVVLVMSGRLTADATGIGVGITSFVVSAIATALWMHRPVPAVAPGVEGI